MKRTAHNLTFLKINFIGIFYILWFQIMGRVRDSFENFPDIFQELIIKIFIIVPAVFLIIYYKNSLKISLKDMFTTKVNLKMFFIVLCFTVVVVIVGSFVYHNKLFIDPGYRHLFSIYYYLLVGLAEELVFRGFLFNAVWSVSSKKKAIIISTLFFMLVHWPQHIIMLINTENFNTFFFIQQSVVTFVSGIMYAYIFSKDKSIWNVALLHAFYDYATTITKLY